MEDKMSQKKQIVIEIDHGVSVDFFCDITKLMTKRFGKKLVIPLERMETLRRAAAVLECIGEECKAKT